MFIDLRERERNIDVRETLIHTLTGGSNLQPFGVWDNTPTNHVSWPGLLSLYPTSVTASPQSVCLIVECMLSTCVTFYKIIKF